MADSKNDEAADPGDLSGSSLESGAGPAKESRESVDLTGTTASSCMDGSSRSAIEPSTTLKR